MAAPPAGALGDRSFQKLWTATLLAQTGSALGAVGVPLVAVRELGLTTGTISLLAASGAAVLALAALPAGQFAEFHRKRPIMVGTDVVRAATFAGLAGLLLLGQLHVVWLFLAIAVNAAAQILFQSASAAFVKSLLDPRARAEGLGRLQAATWTALILGPMLAGVIAAVMSSAVLLAGNALTFVVSAILIARIPAPRGDHATPRATDRRLTEALDGARLLLRSAFLRRLFVAWLLFAGAVAALTP